MSQNHGQTHRASGTIARMTTRTLALGVAGLLTLGGVAFSAAEARAPQPQCKVVSVQTETRAVSRPAPGTYTGPSDQTGTQQRTVTTSKCRGKQTVTYSAWH